MKEYLLHLLPSPFRKAMLTMAICFSTAIVFAFTSPGNVSYETPDGWILDQTTGNVNLYHMITFCSGNKVVFLKFENKNDYAVKLSWQETFVTMDRSVEKKEGPFKSKELTVPTGETAASDCADQKQVLLIAKPDQDSPVYHADIRQFNFINVTVTPTK